MSQKLNELEKEWLFSFASDETNIKNAKSLLEKDPNLATKKDFILGYTALHWASKNGKFDMVDFLLTHGVDTELRTNGGYTALHLATMYNHNDVVLLLIDDYGANIDARDHSGKRPKDYLKRNAMPSVKNKLQRLDSCGKANGEKPMTNISNMFLQMCLLPTESDVCNEEKNVFLSPFFLPGNPEIKNVRSKDPTIRRSLVTSTFRKVRPKLRKTTRVAVDDRNVEAKKRIGSPVPMRNNFLDFSGIPREVRAKSEPDVGKLIQKLELKLDES